MTADEASGIAKERVQDFKAFNKYTNKMVDIIKTSSLTDTPVDVQALFGRFTLDTAGEFLFGTSDLNTLDLPLPAAGKAELGPKGTATEGAFGSFAVAFEDAQMHVIKRASATDVFWTAREFFKDKSGGNRKILDEYLFPLAKKAIAESQARQHGKGEALDARESFLENLAASTDGKSPSRDGCMQRTHAVLDIQVVRDQLLNMLLAARDTVRA